MSNYSFNQVPVSQVSTISWLAILHIKIIIFRFLPLGSQYAVQIWKNSHANAIRGLSINCTSKLHNGTLKLLLFFPLFFFTNVNFYFIVVWVFGVRRFLAWIKHSIYALKSRYFQWVSPVFLVESSWFFFSYRRAKQFIQWQKVKRNEWALSNPEN